jgi:hypothetical protein
MTDAMNETITRLVLMALEKAGAARGDWYVRLKISPAKLNRLRSGVAMFSDADLDRISRAYGEPWSSLVVNELGKDSAISTDTLKMLANLHALEQTANAESRREAALSLSRKSHRGRPPRRVKVA